MHPWLDRAAAASAFMGLFLGGALTIFLPWYAVIAAGTLGFGFGVLLDLATSGRPYRSMLAIAVASLVIGEAYVHPPMEFMDVPIGGFDEDPTFQELLSRSNLYCFQCEERLHVRIRVPLGRELSRRDVVEIVEATLPMDFQVGYCGTGVSMRVAKHPIFAEFSPLP